MVRKHIQLAISALISLIFSLGLIQGSLAGDLKAIAVLVPEQGTDYGWNQQGVDAARAVAEKHGLEFMPAEGLGYGDVRPTLRELAEDGAGLMIAHASGYNTAAPEIAKETGVPVAIVDTPEGLVPGLIADYTLSGHDGAYLAGVLAAKMTRTGTVGIVVSGEPPSWNSQSAGFALGVKAGNSGVKIIYAVIGPAAYGDAAGGRRVTGSVISAGADVIFGQGNGSSFGMIQAVETTTATDGGKVWFIDVIGDKSSLDKGHLLSSVLWDMTPVYDAMVNDLKGGTFGTKHYEIGLSDNSVRLLKTPHIPDNLWSEMMGLRDQIISGGVEVDMITDAQAVRKLMTSVDINEG
ncbi:MAG: BMP family protein [Proteobacteria bacterium]|jgi:simple sugar transport system substrate-binding protein|nr:BMP family protein [Pseudomonadota bacterium]MBT5817279.1 BMP family protein [Pseudomonadota bacterium]MBT6350208.1 BMP family protein [Pseudomonadota bacterium]